MLSRSALGVAALTLLPIAIVGAACDGTDAEQPATDAGNDALVAQQPDAAVEPTEVSQKGRALVLQANTPVEGANVTANGATATTDAEGRYSLVVPRGAPVSLRFSKPEFFQLVEQEYVVDKTPYDRGDSLMLSVQTANLLKAFLTAYDDTKGLVVVKVVPTKGCPSEGGTELSLDTPGATVKYTVGGLPGNATSLAAGENNGALFYNVAPNVPVKVIAKHPTCAQLPFPVAYQGVTYTEKLVTEPGQSFSFVRIFLGPGAAGDAGADATTDDAGADATSTDAATD